MRMAIAFSTASRAQCSTFAAMLPKLWISGKAGTSTRVVSPSRVSFNAYMVMILFGGELPLSRCRGDLGQRPLFLARVKRLDRWINPCRNRSLPLPQPIEVKREIPKARAIAEWFRSSARMWRRYCLPVIPSI